MRVLRMATVVVAWMALGQLASAAMIVDDFSTDTSSDYSVRTVLSRSGSVYPTRTYTGGELQLTSTGSSGVPTQTLILHNTAKLGVGSTVLVDIDLANGAFGTNSSEMIGLAVSAGIMNGVTLPSGTVDVRDDEYSFLFGGFRNQGGRDIFRSDGFQAVNNGSITETNIDQGVSSSNSDPNLANIKSLFINHQDLDVYNLGWVDNLNLPHLVRTVTLDLGPSPYIGLFTDTRNASFNQSVDNLRIVPEPGSLLLASLMCVGLGCWTRVAKA